MTPEEAENTVEYLMLNPEERELLLVPIQAYENIMAYIEALEAYVKALKEEKSDAEAAIWNAIEQS